MTTHDETHEVSTSDSKTSKYETGITMFKYGYLALTIALAVKWFATFTGLRPENDEIAGELEMAWVAWTAGLLGYTIGKETK